MSLRDESFGALAYHHVNRRLVFLKSRELVELVRRLDDFDSADAALDELVERSSASVTSTVLSSLHRIGSA